MRTSSRVSTLKYRFRLIDRCQKRFSTNSCVASDKDRHDFQTNRYIRSKCPPNRRFLRPVFSWAYDLLSSQRTRRKSVIVCYHNRCENFACGWSVYVRSATASQAAILLSSGESPRPSKVAIAKRVMAGFPISTFRLYAELAERREVFARSCNCHMNEHTIISAIDFFRSRCLTGTWSKRRDAND